MEKSLSDLEDAAQKKMTRRDRFLAEINAAAPWLALLAEVKLLCFEGDGPGRPPFGLAQKGLSLRERTIVDDCYTSCILKGETSSMAANAHQSIPPDPRTTWFNDLRARLTLLAEKYGMRVYRSAFP